MMSFKEEIDFVINEIENTVLNCSNKIVLIHSPLLCWKKENLKMKTDQLQDNQEMELNVWYLYEYQVATHK